MKTQNYAEWKIAVIGADTAGINIAFHMANKGHEVNLYDTTVQNVSAQMKRIANNLGEYDGVTGGQFDKINSRIHLCCDIAVAVKNVQLVIDTVYESADKKKSSITHISALCNDDTILACNTSMINVFESVAEKELSNVIIAHFSEPSYITKTVELSCGSGTSKETAEHCANFLKCVDKVCVYSKPVPGLILDRINQALTREFSYMVSQGWATPTDIDTAVAAHYGVRTTFEGVFGQADHSGLDITKNIATLLGPEICSSPTVCGELCREYVNKDRLGMKTAKGFFDYQSADEAYWERDTRLLLMLDKIHEVEQMCETWKAKQK